MRARLKLIFSLTITSLTLSGCSISDLWGGNTSTWNQDAQALNQRVNCPAGGVEAPAAGSYATPTTAWDQNDIIEVAFDSNGNPQPSGTNTLKYFRIDQGAKVPAYKVDLGIWTYVDKMWNGFAPIDQTKSANLAQDTMFIPLVTPQRKLMTNIITPSSQNASVGRWPRASQSEIYTMNKSFYFNEKLSSLNYYQPLKWPNVPAIIFILYKPSTKYAELTHAERIAQVPEYETPDALRFDVYYSVAQYNLHFNQKTCALASHPSGLTPPQKFTYCHSAQAATGPVSKETQKQGLVETAFNSITKLSSCALRAGQAFAADTSITAYVPASKKRASFWSRIVTRVKSWFGVSADTSDAVNAIASKHEGVWRLWANNNPTTLNQYWNSLSGDSAKSLVNWSFKNKANSNAELWDSTTRFDTRLYDGTWLGEWMFTPTKQAPLPDGFTQAQTGTFTSAFAKSFKDIPAKAITLDKIDGFKKQVVQEVSGTSSSLGLTAGQKTDLGTLVNNAEGGVPVAEGLPEPVGEQQSPDPSTPGTSQPGQNLNQPKLHKEEVAKCQEKCDLGPTNLEWPETWNPFWLTSNSNDFTKAGVACFPDPSTNPLSPKKATRTDGCGDDVKNKLCYATTPDCSLGTLRCSSPQDARNATPAFSCLGDFSGQAHECGTERTEKWCPNEKQLEPLNVNDIVATLTIFDKPAFSAFTKPEITQPHVSDLLNWDWIGLLTNDANRDEDSQGGSQSAAWDPLKKIASGALEAIISLWKPQLKQSSWSKELGLSVKPGTKYYSLSALQANLDPNNRGGCYNDSTFYDSKGNQDWNSIMKCAFAHAEYEVTFGDDMNSFGGAGRSNQGNTLSDLTHGLFEKLGQLDPSKLAKYLKQIGEWTKQMGYGLDDTTDSLQNAAQQAQQQASGGNYSQPEPGEEGAHPPAGADNEKNTGICYYTPE